MKQNKEHCYSVQFAALESFAVGSKLAVSFVAYSYSFVSVIVVAVQSVVVDSTVASTVAVTSFVAVLVVTESLIAVDNIIVVGWINSFERLNQLHLPHHQLNG